MNVLLGILFGITASLYVQNPDTLDQKLNEIFNRQYAPGAVVIWVKGDSTLIKYSYGLANLEEEREIKFDETIFRVRSVSKPFASIGILQGVEHGILDLDSDINSYFENPLIKDRFNQSVTLRHLLTHTPGFDDRFIGKSARTKEQALSLKESIETLLPRRFIEPGEIASYSNFGVALAGYLLEHVSGREFSGYMEEKVFYPLGMMNSSFNPGKSVLKNFMTGYFPARDGQMPLQYDYLNDGPAGMMVSTVNDMELFMHQILRQDGLEQAGVLSEEMTMEMLSIQFTHHPRLAGGFGFLWNIFEFNGHMVLGHDGGYIGSAARLFLFPEHNSAMFIAANMMDFEFISEVSSLLANSFLPNPKPAQETSDSFEIFQDGRPITDFAGTWRNTRYSKFSFTKIAVLMGMMGHEMTTAAVSDSILTMPTHTGDIRRMVRVEPFLFQSIDDDYRIAFRESGDKITHVFTSGSTALERLHPAETKKVQIPLLAGSYFFFLLLSVSYPVIFLYRKFRQQEPVSTSISRTEFGLSLSYALTVLLPVPVFYFLPLYELFIGFGYGVPWPFYIINLLPYAALILTIVLIWLAVRTKNLALSRRVFSFVIVVISLACFLSLNYWNFTGWNF